MVEATSDAQAARSRRREREGTVISDKLDKTVVVAVSRAPSRTLGTVARGCRRGPSKKSARTVTSTPAAKASAGRLGRCRLGAGKR